jgi:hypothetical protein
MEDTVKVIIACAAGIIIGIVLCALMKKSQPEYAYIPQQSFHGYQNEETIVWTDWRGRERRIAIHRDAKVL